MSISLASTKSRLSLTIPGINPSDLSLVSVFADIQTKCVFIVVEGKDKRTLDEFCYENLVLDGELSNHNGDPSGIQTIRMAIPPPLSKGILRGFRMRTSHLIAYT